MKSTNNSTPIDDFMEGLCPMCATRPTQWGGTYCIECSSRIQRRQRVKQRWDIASRWITASVIEGVLGLGVGAITLVPIVTGPQLLFSLNGLIIIIIFLSIMVCTVAFAHSFIMRPIIHHWRTWGLVDGGELFLNWIVVVMLVIPFGFFHGLVAIASSISGAFTALLQYNLLRRDTSYAWVWVVASVFSWIIAGSIATYVEMVLPTVIVGVVWGVAAGRTIYGLMSGPVLAWIMTYDASRMW